MKKGKSRTRNARANLLRVNAANARRKQRKEMAGGGSKANSIRGGS